MQSDKLVDHLFRYEYGKIVSALTRLFGIHQLDMIEDVVQDTFHKAVLHFRNKGIPENPEAWLRTVAKNRAIDIWRKKKLKNEEELTNYSGTSAIAFSEVFSDNEIEDNQLRLLFTICNPSLKIKDQVIFALKTFSGFSRKEISVALLLSEENVKKSLLRAKKKVVNEKVALKVPVGKEVKNRLDNIHLVLYLLFNEGFHSSNKKQLVRKDLVAEAMRLNELLISKFNDSNSKALMALMCFHGSRLDSKITEDNDLITLKNQDRKKWNFPLIFKGHELMNEVVKSENYSRFHWEAAIAGEYAKASSYEKINWENLEFFYRNLIILIPSAFNKLNLSVILNEAGKTDEAHSILNEIETSELQGRLYLYYAVSSEIAKNQNNTKKALNLLLEAIKLVNNDTEKKLILSKIKNLKS